MDLLKQEEVLEGGSGCIVVVWALYYIVFGDFVYSEVEELIFNN